MKGGMPVLEMTNPVIRPIIAPSMMLTSIARIRGMVPRVTNSAVTAPDTPAMDPTVRSIPPVIMANAMPQARIP